MDLDYFTRLMQGPVARLIRWLQHRSLLANPLHCSGCNRDMELVEREAGHVDGYQWFVFISFTNNYYLFCSRLSGKLPRKRYSGRFQRFFLIFFRMRELSELTRDGPAIFHREQR